MIPVTEAVKVKVPDDRSMHKQGKDFENTTKFAWK
jgi:hypothetical protein